jgi:uncharacterized protein (DUF1501 family)
MKSKSRRSFLKNLSACTCASLAAGHIPGLAFSTANASYGNGNKLLIINMSGGWDGLQLCQPSSGSLYTTLATLRPTLKTDPSQLLSLNSNYGLHPSLTTLKTIYDEGHLAAIMKVGYQNMSRSHMDSEVTYARGVGDRLSPQASGIINRLGATFGWNSMQAFSVDGTNPAFEGGEYRGVLVNSLSSFNFASDYSQSIHETTHRKQLIKALSTSLSLDSNKPKQSDAMNGIAAAVDYSGQVRSAIQSTTFPNSYPNTVMGRSLKDIDILFSNTSLGTQVGYVRRSGFDTHANQTSGFSTLLPEFNNSLSTFIANMKAKGLWNNLMILVISEFGRTNEENGSEGTDHGGGCLAFLLGGLVNSGVYGDITTSDLTNYEWLPMQYNIVEVYRQVISKMGYDPDMVFEASSGPSLNGIV